MRRRVAMAVVAAVSVVIGVMGTEPMTAVATDGEMVVTEDTTLTEDHDGNILVNADNVTLDCDGHTISGSGATVGILLEQRTGVTVKNCEVTGHVVGISLFNSSENTLEGNTANGNVEIGFELGSSSSGNVLTDNAANGNGGIGFFLPDSSGNTLEQNTANGNGENGFFIQASVGNALTNNTANTNGISGFFLNDSSGNTLKENTAIENPDTNFNVADSDNNTFDSNLAMGGFRGFHLGNSDGNTFVGNTVIRTTGGAGFIFNHSSNNVLTANVAENNQAQGFTSFLGSEGNTFTANSAHANSDTGFSDADAAANTYVDNVCVANAQGSDPNGLCDESGSFTDDDGNTFELDIEWMNREGITKGCNPPTNDEFCPNDSVTRGQMAAFLVRALGYTDDGGGDLFTDDDSSVFENDIDKLATAGVTKGCNPPTNDNYCPDDLVTRGQMAAFLVRALDYTDNGGGDLFTDDDGNTFESDIDKLGTAGVTKGCNPPTNDQFCPNDFVTRGQMAAFLRRALDK